LSFVSVKIIIDIMDMISGLINILFLTAAGYIGGELASKVSLPKVLGYLLAGMVVGPFALGFVDVSVLDVPIMKAFLLVSIGFVGYLVGAGIHVDELKKSGSSTFIIGLLEAYVPFVLISAFVYLILGWDLISSLVVGAIALATAPAMALSISQEYKTDGPVTRALLPIVAIDDVLAVATFGVIIAFAGSFYSGAEISVIAPFVEILLSIGLGVLAGFVGYYIFRNMKKKVSVLVSSIIVILITLLIGLAVHAELFMVGIAFGVVLVNMFTSTQKKLFEDSTNQLSGVAMIVFMVLIGTTLDITAILSVIALAGAVAYVLIRGIGKVGGASIGAKITKSPKTVQKYLGFTLLPAAGISLTFVGLATPVIPVEYGAILGVVIAAAALVNEVVAVFAIKWAFGKSGEIGVGK